MCGIFGVWEMEGGRIDVGRLQEAATSMRHRGPDDEGYVLVDTASGRTVACGGDDTPASLGLPHLREMTGERFDLALAHRRLAILDTSPRGHQPMSDGRNWIVHSGEIFNYLELQGAGRSATTDTEVLLSLLSPDGDTDFNSLDGMWATAFWMPSSRSLLLSRDRFGIKPLSYAVSDDGRFIFGSEIKSIAAYEGAWPAMDEGATADYLAWGITDHDERTFFKGVSQLLPGHRMNVGAAGIRLAPYWDADACAPVGGGAPLEGGIREALAASVARRLRSDVPVGTLLSGGLDSSSITCLVRESLDVKESLSTFTAGFEDPLMDERRFSDLVASAVGAEQHIVVPDGNESLSALPRVVSHQEAPFGSLSVFAQWKVMELARDSGVTVVLDGQGGDELFSGYPQAFELHLRRMLSSGRWVQAWSEASAMGSGMSAIRRAVARSRSRLRQLPRWLDPELETSDSWRYADDGSLRDMMAQDLRCRLPSLLRYEERNSMAFGLEARIPFLDHELVRIAFELSDDDRVGEGVGKVALRRAMRGTVPDPILDRRDKIGFSVPERDWLLGGNRRTEVEERIRSGPALDLPFVRSEVAIGLLGSRRDVGAVWRLLCLTEWMQMFA